MEQEYLIRHMTPDEMQHKENTYPWECIDTCKNMKQDYNTYGNIPVQNMGSKIYAVVYRSVLVSINKVMPNMSQMPKAISKDNFNMIVNDCMCSLTKDEKKLKELMKSRCKDFTEYDRAFCPYCDGMLKSVVEIALITSLINGGCLFCF